METEELEHPYQEEFNRLMVALQGDHLTLYREEARLVWWARFGALAKRDAWADRIIGSEIAHLLLGGAREAVEYVTSLVKGPGPEERSEGEAEQDVEIPEEIQELLTYCQLEAEREDGDPTEVLELCQILIDELTALFARTNEKGQPPRPGAALPPPERKPAPSKEEAEQKRKKRLAARREQDQRRTAEEKERAERARQRSERPTSPPRPATQKDRPPTKRNRQK